MKRGNVKTWPVFFIKNIHNWENIFIEENDGYVKPLGVKCVDCHLKAIQDIGSLGYFVVGNDVDIAKLTCEEIQIRNIIK